jgi:hypothetical protein
MDGDLTNIAGDISCEDEASREVAILKELSVQECDATAVQSKFYAWLQKQQ